MRNIRTILVPVDFSEGSCAAVRHARELADMFRSHIHLLHVAPGPDAPRWAVEMFADEIRPIHEQNRINALDQLATLIVAQRLDPFRTTGLVRAGCAEKVIADYADEVHADLIVMGLHGDRRVPYARVGEVVERVLGAVRCPVLTIPDERTTMLSAETPEVDRSLVAC